MAYTTGYLGNFTQVAPTIANSGTTSTAISCGGMVPVGVKLPAAFTGTALTFSMCDTLAGTYVPVCGIDGSPISYTVAQGKYYALDPKDFQGILFLKIISGSTEGGLRTLSVSLKGL